MLPKRPFSFDLTVRQFTPDKVVVSIDDKWAFENDRSMQAMTNIIRLDDDSDRDNGVPLNITPPKGRQCGFFNHLLNTPCLPTAVPCTHNIVEQHT